ncbi:type VII secretion system-associated protein [Streptomyces sp. NPDC090080]|uniref:type VII secretion system-associated protein n=1 Tax=Streptomyces sp. NPDC090080 TaxID=3365939 RepID=UPI00381E9806
MSADLTKLDPKHLENFVTHDIADFQSALKGQRQTVQWVRCLYDLSNAADPVSLGPMLSSSDVGGQDVAGNLKKAAGAIDEVFAKHILAFDTIEQNLKAVLSDMAKTKSGTLDKLDEQKFMDDLGPYFGALAGQNTTDSKGGSGDGSGT